MDELLEGLIDKDECDQEGEALLRKSGDVPHEGAEVKGHDEDQSQ